MKEETRVLTSQALLNSLEILIEYSAYYLKLTKLISDHGRSEINLLSLTEQVLDCGLQLMSDKLSLQCFQRGNNGFLYLMASCLISEVIQFVLDYYLFRQIQASLE